MTYRISPVLAALLLAGCASDPAPLAQLEVSEQALRQAREVGASEELAALREAEGKLQAARAAFAAEDYRQARMLAEQAELDARLAEAQTLTARKRAQVEVLKGRIQALRSELGGQP